MPAEAVVIQTGSEWATACEVQQRSMRRLGPAIGTLDYSARETKSARPKLMVNPGEIASMPRAGFEELFDGLRIDNEAAYAGDTIEADGNCHPRSR